MENIKQSVLSHSKKSRVKARFLSKKPKEKNSKFPHVATASSLASASTSAQATNTDYQLEKMVQSVLDLFPELETSFIKVIHL